MTFNENSRVKIPTILHLQKLGYQYLSLKESRWDKKTNIFTSIFKDSLSRINPGITDRDIEEQLINIRLLLDYEDMGKAFYEKLVSQSGIKLIDFENFGKNSFNVVTELTYKKDEDEFRPDITLLINGMPLVFIEVKKPYNQNGGILDEKQRINTRLQNPKFRSFANITQLMIFSNNMEYDDDSSQPIEGAFYATSSTTNVSFNYFREEDIFNLTALLSPLSEQEELHVLKDNNLEVIKHNLEFKTNKSPDSPTNRICTSLLNKERLAFILQYAFAYVNDNNGIEKHVMRYPQLFATKAIKQKLDEGIKKGIIWHTQGSGKTALTYYNVRFLTDYFQNKNIVPKFYFIVDRLDLLRQAKNEFSKRGLTVHTIQSRDEFAKDIKTNTAVHNDSGKSEITVVNIQKFADDPNVIQNNGYDLSIQRIYFLDEVHRSYNPKGSFLANLKESDRNAIKIGLTGTPLLGDDYKSRDLFGEYIHKYYYNSSIADGYTLRLIREEIVSNYQLELEQALTNITIEKGDIERRKIYAHHRFVEPMLDYIVSDFEKSRGAMNDYSIGGMVICDSSDQAKMLLEIFNKKYLNKPSLDNDIRESHRVKTARLILHDVGTKEERKDWVEDFKAGKIDLLFVYNMLLTGFDAKRLKKLYLGRVIKKHNLLQALTRVNRTYKDMRYGYVVDFADIRNEFEKTNEDYFKELQGELGDEKEHYSKLFKSKEEISQDIEHIKDVLFRYDTGNAEVFSQQIGNIQDKKTILLLKKVLSDARSLYNIIRQKGEYEFLTHLDFNKLSTLYRETCNHLNMLNIKENLEHGNESNNLLNLALEDIYFQFVRIGEEELILADQLKTAMRRTREALANNFDQKDSQFITLREELERLFKKKNLNIVTQKEMSDNIHILNKIHERIKKLNRDNNQLREKYSGDTKFTRIHKRLWERKDISDSERKIFAALNEVKNKADQDIVKNTQIMSNDGYFKKLMMPIVLNEFDTNQKFDLSPDASRYINSLIVNEYLNEYHAGVYL